MFKHTPYHLRIVPLQYSCISSCGTFDRPEEIFFDTMRASPAAQLVGIIRIICKRQNLLQNNLHALGPPETQRRRYRPVRGSVWVGGTHCVMRSRVPSPSSIRPLMHDAHSSRALRLKHRRPAQSRLSPQQPLHALCPRLRSDNIRRQPNTLCPPPQARRRLCTQIRTHRCWPIQRRSTRRPRRRAHYVRTGCCPCSCGS